ncbi:PLAT/LH2 domain-containing protein [Pseudoalteromonas piscicida]|uniref:PLAT/LH2 domain-containing protein n=1 Tax=Pseudoalteromonas piscicida TaxID=43662 RepID=UPI0030A66DA3
MKHVLKPLLIVGLALSPVTFANELADKVSLPKLTQSVSNFEKNMKQYEYQDEEAYIQEYILEFGNGEPADQWARASFCQGLTTEYIVTVYTSNIYRAGTGSRIHMKVNWGASSSQWTRLDNTSRNDFEQGSIDDFYLHLLNRGSIVDASVSIKSDGSGSKAGWHLDRIEIEDTCTGDVGTARFNRWISKSVGLSSTRPVN